MPFLLCTPVYSWFCLVRELRKAFVVDLFYFNLDRSFSTPPVS